jgi:hypothetical protein
MPAQTPLPTIAQFVKAAGDALHGEIDPNLDARSGSIYNDIAGPMAVLLSREADRDADLFKNIYFASAVGDALTAKGLAMFHVPRYLSTYGQGACSFKRSSAVAGNGTLLQGTRIQVNNATPTVYHISTDTLVIGTSAANVPIQATVLGTGQAVTGASSLTLLDPCYDPLWAPVSLTCADGTDFEPAADYRARCLSTTLNARNGYLPEMMQVCQNAGAANVVGFPSYYGLAQGDFIDDFGLNAIYIGDASYSSPPSLVNACAVALDGARMGGADLWVGGFNNLPLTINALVRLRDTPSKCPLVSIRRAICQALLGYFGPSDAGFTWKARGLSASMTASSSYIQSAGVPLEWTPLTMYGVGDLIFNIQYILFHAPRVQTYQCVSAGQSGALAPAWPPFASIPGTTVQDSSAEWEVVTPSSLGVYAGGNIQTADPTLSPTVWAATLNRYTLAGRGINLFFSGPI